MVITQPQVQAARSMVKYEPAEDGEDAPDCGICNLAYSSASVESMRSEGMW